MILPDVAVFPDKVDSRNLGFIFSSLQAHPAQVYYMRLTNIPLILSLVSGTFHNLIHVRRFDNKGWGSTSSQFPLPESGRSHGVSRWIKINMAEGEHWN